MMHPAETRYSYVDIFLIWEDEKKRTPGIEIPYLSWNKTKLMAEFIEPFLVDLSKFLSEEERAFHNHGQKMEKWKIMNQITEEFL